jgi:Rps23 Pro-64 3,4-dihydroxylase Tpa1-like proline 4-hydroxylase
MGEPAGPLPPHHRYRDFLPAAELAALLGHTLASRDRFRPSTVGGGRLDHAIRRSERLRDIGSAEVAIRQRLAETLPDIRRRLGGRPFDLTLIELELAAHGEGAHFAPHIDLPVGPDRKPVSGDGVGTHDRIVSGVLYFHREPKCFSGGALRLHRFGAEPGAGGHVDLEPEQNSLVVFPSWAMHEVREVRCPSGRFDDSRFALNVWFCRDAV